MAGGPAGAAGVRLARIVNRVARSVNLGATGMAILLAGRWIPGLLP